MKKILLPFVLLLVGLGLGYSIPHGAKPQDKTPLQQQEQAVAGLYNPNSSQFVSGLTAGSTNQFAVDSSGNATTSGNFSAATTTASVLTATLIKSTSIGVSTSTGGSLGSASAGFISIPNLAAAANFTASSTVLDINSQVFLTQISTSTNAALLAAMGANVCSNVVATTSVAAGIFASTTSANLNYFKIGLSNTSIPFPLCLSYGVRN